MNFDQAAALAHVLLFMSFVDPFVRWIERLLPDRGPELTRHLDASLYQVPTVALEASALALRETTRTLLATLQDVLANPAAAVDVSARQSEVDAALARIQVFFAGISHESDAQTKPALRVAQLPAMAARDLKQRQVEGQAGPEDALHILDALALARARSAPHLAHWPLPEPGSRCPRPTRRGP